MAAWVCVCVRERERERERERDEGLGLLSLTPRRTHIQNFTSSLTGDLIQNSFSAGAAATRQTSARWLLSESDRVSMWICVSTAYHLLLFNIPHAHEFILLILNSRDSFLWSLCLHRYIILFMKSLTNWSLKVNMSHTHTHKQTNKKQQTKTNKQKTSQNQNPFDSEK